MAASVDATTGTISWNFAALASGDSIVLTVTGQLINTMPAGIDQFVNTVSVTDDGSNGADPTPGNNTDDDINNLNAVPNLSITKTDNGALVNVGETVVYTLTYTNYGTQDATGVLISETLPPGTSFDAAASSAGWVDVGGGMFEYVAGTLAVGEVRVIEFALTIDDPALEDSLIVNTTTITDDGMNGDDPVPG